MYEGRVAFKMITLHKDWRELGLTSSSDVWDIVYFCPAAPATLSVWSNLDKV